MFKKTNLEPEIDYSNDFKVVIANNFPHDNDLLKVHQSPNSLKSLESFSRSSESLALQVTAIETQKHDKKKRKKKSLSATRSKVKEENKTNQYEYSVDDIVSRDQGESFMSEIMRNVNKESREIIGDCEEERLRLMNIRLESKVSKLLQENEESLARRHEIKSELETTKQSLIDTKLVMEEIEDDLNSLKSYRNIDRQKIADLEIQLSAKQSEISGKLVDMRQITNELSHHQDNLCHAEKTVQSLRDELAEKSSTVVHLKKKLSELHTQLELTKLYRENSEYQSDQLRRELETTREAQAWFESQLGLTHETKNRLQQEAARLKSCLADAEFQAEAGRQKIETLELRLVRFRELKLHETSALLLELEQLQAELVVGDQDKRDMEARYDAVRARFDDKVAELNLEQARGRELTREVLEVRAELAAETDKLRDARAAVEAEAAEVGRMRTRVAVLEQAAIETMAAIELLEHDNTELLQRLTTENERARDKDATINNHTAEISTLRVSLEMADRDRTQAQLGFEQLRHDIERVEASFEVARADLGSRDESLRLVEQANEELRADLAAAATEVRQKQTAIVNLAAENRQLTDNCDQFERMNHEVRLELDSVRDGLASADLKIAGLEDELSHVITENQTMTHDLSESRREISQLHLELTNARDTVDRLSGLQASYTALFEDHKRLEVGYNELFGQHRSLTAEYECVTAELRARLDERHEHIEKVTATERSLLGAVETSRGLRDELEQTRFSHTVELASRDERIRELAEKSSRELSEMCQEKIRCEQAIEKLQSHCGTVTEEYGRKLGECRSKMLQLQRQSSAYADYENQCRTLAGELEQKRGEIEAILQVWTALKRHTEQAVVRRDAQAQHAMAMASAEAVRRDEEIMTLRSRLSEQCERTTAEQKLKEILVVQLDERVTVIDQLHKKLEEAERASQQAEQNLSEIQAELEVTVRENETLKKCQDQMRQELERLTGDNRNLVDRNQSLLQNIEQAVFERDKEKQLVFVLQRELDDKCGALEKSKLKTEDLLVSNRRSVDEMATLIKDVRTQNDSLTRKVELTQQQDLIMKAIVSQLRSEVKKIIFERQIELGVTNSVSLSTDQIEKLKKLLNETGEPLTFRPQTRLSKCIEDLRTQIDSMQIEIARQIDDQYPKKSPDQEPVI